MTFVRAWYHVVLLLYTCICTCVYPAWYHVFMYTLFHFSIASDCIHVYVHVYIQHGIMYTCTLFFIFPLPQVSFFLSFFPANIMYMYMYMCIYSMVSCSIVCMYMYMCIYSMVSCSIVHICYLKERKKERKTDT